MLNEGRIQPQALRRSQLSLRLRERLGTRLPLLPITSPDIKFTENLRINTDYLVNGNTQWHYIIRHSGCAFTFGIKYSLLREIYNTKRGSCQDEPTLPQILFQLKSNYAPQIF
jgi:hypothetical protein